jgi:hypothetical protein
MFWNGKPLDVEKLREGSTVMVSYRNRGGCFLVSFTILFMIGGALIASFFTCGLSLCAIHSTLVLSVKRGSVCDGNWKLFDSYR